MKSLLKLFTAIILLTTTFIYFGCSSAEQTTGKLAFSNKDYAKAEVEFEKEVRQNGQNEEAWFYLAMSRLELGKMTTFEDAMKSYRGIGKNTFAQDLIYKWAEKYDEGFNNFDKAKGSTDSSVSLPLYRKALINFKSCMVLLPDSTVAQKNADVIANKIVTIQVKPLIDIGAEMINSGDYAGAIEIFKKAQGSGIDETSPAYEVLTYNTGLAYLKWGESMRTTNPDDPAYKDKYKSALPYLEALKNSADKANKLQAYELLIQVYGNLGMEKEALEAIKIRDDLKNQK